MTVCSTVAMLRPLWTGAAAAETAAAVIAAAEADTAAEEVETTAESAVPVHAEAHAHQGSCTGRTGSQTAAAASQPAAPSPSPAPLPISPHLPPHIFPSAPTSLPAPVSLVSPPAVLGFPLGTAVHIWNGMWHVGRIIEVDVDDLELPYLVQYDDGDLEDMPYAKAATGVLAAETINDRWTPLIVAAHEGNEAAVAALLEAGADVNEASKNGRTALFMSAQEGHDAVVAALLMAGAQADKTRNDGCMPLVVAEQRGQAAVVKLLYPWMLAGGDPVQQYFMQFSNLPTDLLIIGGPSRSRCSITDLPDDIMKRILTQPPSCRVLSPQVRPCSRVVSSPPVAAPGVVN